MGRISGGRWANNMRGAHIILLGTKSIFTIHPLVEKGVYIADLFNIDNNAALSLTFLHLTL